MIKDKEKKEFGAWWMWILALFVATLFILTIMGYFGKVTGTIIERKVFENSYQRSEGLRSQQATWQAQLASINSQLTTAEIGSDLFNQLMSQKAMLEVQIAQTKGMN